MTVGIGVTTLTVWLVPTPPVLTFVVFVVISVVITRRAAHSTWRRDG